MKLTTGIANTSLGSGIKAALDGGTGIIEVRTGSAPATAGAALTGTVLATIPIPSTMFSAASAASLAGASLPWTDSSADSGGTAGYAVARKSGDVATADDTVARLLLTVGVGSGDLQFDNLSIASAQQVSITAFALAQPLS